MLDIIIERFRGCGCPYLEHADSSTQQEWISDLFYSHSADRRLLLEWLIKLLDPDLETVGDMSEIISAFGICSLADAQSFVSGKMNRRNQSKIWFDLSGMVSSSEDVDIEELKVHNNRNENVLDTLANEIKFESFTKSKLNILPFHFEKEIKKSKSGLPDSALPSLETFSETLEKGKLLMETLEQYSNFEEDTEASEALISELGHVCEELQEKLESLNMKHDTEFAAWLGNPHGATSMMKERPEIVEAAQLLRKLSLHLQHKSSTAENVNKVLDYQNKDLKKLSKNIPSIEVDENLDKTSLYLSVLSSSRAPAAS